MAKRTTKTEVVTKAMARSGPEITPEQIRLSDDAQPDTNKVYTQRDYNEAINGGGEGGGGIAPDLSKYATKEALDSEASTREVGDNSLATSMAKEKSDREAVDASLEHLLEIEKRERERAIEALEARIQALEASSNAE